MADENVITPSEASVAGDSDKRKDNSDQNESETKRRRLESNCRDSVPQNEKEEKKEEEPDNEKTDVASGEESNAETENELSNIPSDKVGVVKVEARDTIISLLDDSGAKVLVGYADASPLSTRRHFELVGISESINMAERLMKNMMIAELPDVPVEAERQTGSCTQILSRKMEVPDDKVEVLKGEAGNTILSDLNNSGAKILIMGYTDVNPQSTIRHFALVGTLENIDMAERLMKHAIAEADAGGWLLPSLVDQAASADEQPESPFKKFRSLRPDLSKDDPSDVCRVDKCTDLFLGIDEEGGYYVSNDPQKIPPEYCIKKVEKELFCLRKFQVKKHGADTYDIVMVGCLNITNQVTWIAGDTITYEAPDYPNDDPVTLPPLALTFPATMTVEEYKSKHMDAYTDMLSDRLKCALVKSDYDPAKYCFDKDLCLAVIGESMPRKVSLKPDEYPCDFCGGAGACHCPSESEGDSSEMDSEDLSE